MVPTWRSTRSKPSGLGHQASLSVGHFGVVLQELSGWRTYRGWKRNQCASIVALTLDS